MAYSWFGVDLRSAHAVTIVRGCSKVADSARHISALFLELPSVTRSGGGLRQQSVGSVNLRRTIPGRHRLTHLLSDKRHRVAGPIRFPSRNRETSASQPEVAAEVSSGSRRRGSSRELRVVLDTDDASRDESARALSRAWTRSTVTRAMPHRARYPDRPAHRNLPTRWRRQLSSSGHPARGRGFRADAFDSGNVPAGPVGLDGTSS